MGAAWKLRVLQFPGHVSAFLAPQYACSSSPQPCQYVGRSLELA